MPRFFLQQRPAVGEAVVLAGENAVHAKVLRLKSGDTLTLCDGQGMEYPAVVTEQADGQICAKVLDAVPSVTEPKVQVSIFMAFSKSDKLEHVIQKAIELGAVEIVAFPSNRCVSRPDGKSLIKKLDRWQKIALSAAEQCGRGRIPNVLAADSFAQAVEMAAAKDCAIFFYENERHATFRRRIEAGAFRTVALMTGPEGGFEPSEVTMAEAAGMSVCTLGPRILRCETAPLCALSALMYACGELD